MKKNRLYAAMAAVVLLAAGCTDEIDNNTNGTEDPEGNNGDKVYMTVNISTSGTGSMTKAGGPDEGPTGGEDAGNNFVVGEDFENAVNNAYFYLVELDDNDNVASNPLAVLQGDGGGNKKLISIYAGPETIGSPSGDPLVNPDHRPAITVSVNTDKITFDKNYQVFTVVNAGEDGLPAFTTLDQLRNYLQTKAWTEQASGYSDFVMSTHQLSGDAGASTVKFTTENDKEHPAPTVAYVERLASRIDMKFNAELVGEDGDEVTNPVWIEGQDAASTDYIKLNGYVVVNQLQAGSYMLKRVSEDVTSNITPIPATLDKYLSDENYGGTAYNYVIDPWTGAKKGAADFPTSFESYSNVWSGPALTVAAAVTKNYTDLYKNAFNEDLNDLEFSSVATLGGTDFTRVLYTMENTADVNEQKNGFSTGVIFKGIYTPQYWSAYTADGQNVKVESEAVDGQLTSNKGFFVMEEMYNNHGHKYLCKDLRTAGVIAFRAATDNSDLIKYLFDSSEGSATWPEGDSFDSIDDLKEIVAKIKGGKLGEAYKNYLEQKLEGATFNGDLQKSLQWASFVADGSVPLKDPTVATSTEQNIAETLAKDYGISYYKNGESYYKFWIRHASNGKPNEMGVMEFATVRNNVYQLDVTGVSSLGDPLPFTPGKDDPNTPDESKEVKIAVTIYVKDWVKRFNADIIL